MDKYTRKDAETQFERLIKAIGGRIAQSYKDVGAYRLDWNSAYGGGNIELIVNEQGGVSQPFGSLRYSAKEFCHMVHFTIAAIEQHRKRELTTWR